MNNIGSGMRAGAALGQNQACGSEKEDTPKTDEIVTALRSHISDLQDLSGGLLGVLENLRGCHPTPPETDKVSPSQSGFFHVSMDLLRSCHGQYLQLQDQVNELRRLVG